MEKIVETPDQRHPGRMIRQHVEATDVRTLWRKPSPFNRETGVSILKFDDQGVVVVPPHDADDEERYIHQFVRDWNDIILK